MSENKTTGFQAFLHWRADASWLNDTSSTGNLQLNPLHATNLHAVVLPGLAASVGRFCSVLNKHVRGRKIIRNE